MKLLDKFVFDFFQTLAFRFRQAVPYEDAAGEADDAIEPERSGCAQSAVQHWEGVRQDESGGPKGEGALHRHNQVASQPRQQQDQKQEICNQLQPPLAPAPPLFPCQFLHRSPSIQERKRINHPATLAVPMIMIAATIPISMLMRSPFFRRSSDPAKPYRYNTI